MEVTVIGAGLAGSEAAWQLAQRGIRVTLREMKPEKKTPAHETEYYAELCCSNSLRSDQLENAVGLLKEELLLAGLTEFFGQLCCVALALGEDALHIQIMPGAQGISHVVNTLAAVGLAGRGIDNKNMFHKTLRYGKE